MDRELRYKELLNDNRIRFGVKGTGRPMVKKFLTEVKELRLIRKYKEWVD